MFRAKMVCWRGLKKQGSDSDNQQEHMVCQGEGFLLMYVRYYIMYYTFICKHINVPLSVWMHTRK